MKVRESAAASFIFLMYSVRVARQLFTISSMPLLSYTRRICSACNCVAQSCCSKISLQHKQPSETAAADLFLLAAVPFYFPRSLPLSMIVSGCFYLLLPATTAIDQSCLLTRRCQTECAMCYRWMHQELS